MADGVDLVLPECPTCGRMMMLSRIEPLNDDVGLDRRTFECRWCPHSESYAIEVHRKRSLLNPFGGSRTPH